MLSDFANLPSADVVIKVSAFFFQMFLAFFELVLGVTILTPTLDGQVFKKLLLTPSQTFEKTFGTSFVFFVFVFSLNRHAAFQAVFFDLVLKLRNHVVQAQRLLQFLLAHLPIQSKFHNQQLN